MKFLLFFLFCVNINAGIFEREVPKKEKELNELFGELKCYPYASQIHICENNYHFCYKYSGHKKGSFQCFSKEEILNKSSKP